MNGEDTLIQVLKANPSFDGMVAILSFIASAILLSIGIRKGSKSRLIGTYVPADSIKSIPPDIPVIVNGLISATNPLISPITKKPY